MLGIACAVAFIWLRPYRGKMWELATSVDNVRVGLVKARHIPPIALTPRLLGLVMCVA